MCVCVCVIKHVSHICKARAGSILNVFLKCEKHVSDVFCILIIINRILAKMVAVIRLTSFLMLVLTHTDTDLLSKVDGLSDHPLPLSVIVAIQKIHVVALTRHVVAVVGQQAFTE